MHRSLARDHGPQSCAAINLVEPAAHQIAVAELYRRHRFAKRQLKLTRAGSQRLLFE
jgi:hypothetical protein